MQLDITDGRGVTGGGDLHGEVRRVRRHTRQLVFGGRRRQDLHATDLPGARKDQIAVLVVPVDVPRLVLVAPAGVLPTLTPADGRGGRQKAAQRPQHDLQARESGQVSADRKARLEPHLSQAPAVQL